MDDDKQLERKVRRAFELEEGKTIIVNFGNTSVRADYRCMDKDTDVCEECGLRFYCYTSQYLTLDAKLIGFSPDFQETINERVEAYIERFKTNKGGKNN